MFSDIKLTNDEICLVSPTLQVRLCKFPFNERHLGLSSEKNSRIRSEKSRESKSGFSRSFLKCLVVLNTINSLINSIPPSICRCQQAVFVYDKVRFSRFKFRLREIMLVKSDKADNNVLSFDL